MLFFNIADCSSKTENALKQNRAEKRFGGIRIAAPVPLIQIIPLLPCPLKRIRKLNVKV